MALAALGAYLALAPHVSGDGDGSEWTLVLALNGAPHPTGYPLYVLAGHAFCRLLHALGVGWPYAANAFSAVGAAAAIYLLHRLALRLARAWRGVGPAGRYASQVEFLAVTLPIAALAVNPIFTNEGMLAEVNSWHTAWVAGLSLLFARMVDPRAVSASSTRSGAYWGLAVGLGMAHHLTAVLIAIPLTMALLFTPTAGRQLRRAWLPAIASAAGVLFIAIAIVAWRAAHPAPIQWPSLEPGARALADYLTGAGYRHFLGYFAPSPEHRRLLAEAAYPGLAVGVAALAALALRGAGAARRTLGLGFLAATMAVLIYGFHYGVPDPAPYFLPAMALSAAALGALLATISTGASVARPIRYLALTAGVLGVVALGTAGTREALARRAEILSLERVVRSMWAAVPDDSALVFWPDDRYLRLREYQLLRGEKRSLTIETPEQLVNDRPRARFREQFGVDPLEGLNLPRLRPGAPGEREAIERFLVEVVRNVNMRTQRPVIVFDPSGPTVRVLTKPGAAQ